MIRYLAFHIAKLQKILSHRNHQFFYTFIASTIQGNICLLSYTQYFTPFWTYIRWPSAYSSWWKTLCYCHVIGFIMNWLISLIQLILNLFESKIVRGQNNWKMHACSYCYPFKWIHQTTAFNKWVNEGMNESCNVWIIRIWNIKLSKSSWSELRTKNFNANVIPSIFNGNKLLLQYFL